MAGKTSTSSWMSCISQSGPIGLLLFSVHLLGCKVDDSLRTWRQGEPPISLLATAFQYLAPLLTELAISARTAAVVYAKEETRWLTKIDRIAALHHVAKLRKEDQAYLRIVQCGGGCGKAELFDMGLRADASFDYCPEARCTP